MLSGLVSFQTPRRPADFLTGLTDNTAAHCGWWRHGLSGFRKNFTQGDQNPVRTVSGSFRFFFLTCVHLSPLISWQEGTYEAERSKPQVNHHLRIHRHPNAQLISDQRRKDRRMFSSTLDHPSLQRRSNKKSSKRQRNRYLIFNGYTFVN